MRISDWSSDVCSSDLLGEEVADHQLGARDRLHLGQVDADNASAAPAALNHHLGPAAGRAAKVDHTDARLQEVETVVELGELEGGARAVAALARFGHEGIVRSEEHTSELQ